MENQRNKMSTLVASEITNNKLLSANLSVFVNVLLQAPIRGGFKQRNMVLVFNYLSLLKKSSNSKGLSVFLIFFYLLNKFSLRIRIKTTKLKGKTTFIPLPPLDVNSSRANFIQSYFHGSNSERVAYLYLANRLISVCKQLMLGVSGINKLHSDHYTLAKQNRVNVAKIRKYSNILKSNAIKKSKNYYL